MVVCRLGNIFFRSIIFWKHLKVTEDSQGASKDNIPVTKYKSDNLAVEIKRRKADLVPIAGERITKCRDHEIP